MTRTATCGCGAVRVECDGDPVRVSVCHCLACKRRSGSAFSAQARFPEERVRIDGETRDWVRIGESGGRAVFSFCPNCGSTAHYRIDSMPGVVAVPMGNFADPAFDPPAFSVWEVHKHPWVAVLGDVEHD